MTLLLDIAAIIAIFAVLYAGREVKHVWRLYARRWQRFALR